MGKKKVNQAFGSLDRDKDKDKRRKKRERDLAKKQGYKRKGGGHWD
jgi:hypothetical protein